MNSETVLNSTENTEANAQLDDINLDLSDIFEEPNEIIQNEMANNQPAEFLRLAAQTINRNYTGEPLALNAFINSVELLRTVAGDNIDILKRFILTKLEGKALESIPNDPPDIDTILNALKANIKPDSSKVIEGRMLSLKLDSTKVQDYSEQAEKLAEALQRSLIIEGITQVKAKEMAIDRTVEMCRQSAKSDLVKSVLAASKFESPQEVLAKFVIEANTEKKEKQILAYKSQQRRGGFRGRGFKNNNNGRNYNYDNNNRNNNGYNNNNGRNNNYNNNRGRGRGQGRGRGGYYNNNNNYNNQNQNNNRYIRYAENAQVPSQGWRADNQQQNNQQQQFYVPYHNN